jgi:UDP-N-acetylglucosamine 4-epimerase
MTRYEEVQALLSSRPRRWLVTGVAGFIGSHLLEALLRLDQSVVGLDNFATGSRQNLSEVLSAVDRARAARFHFVEGDICDPRACRAATAGVDLVLHQAALGSVPRSMADPLSTHTSNVDGFVNVLMAANAARVQRVVYASSSSVYGDDQSSPKTEEVLGQPLSPYATSKLVNELYARTFKRTHGIDSVGLRYFNVFGPRQDPRGAYAAVIPRWTEQLFSAEPCVVFGDGSASRDFCFVDNVVQANLLAASAPASQVLPGVFNVGCGAETSLLELFAAIRMHVATFLPGAERKTLHSEAPRPGDVPHSLASIDRARGYLGYRPAYDLSRGLQATIGWYATRRGQSPVFVPGTIDASPRREPPEPLAHA